MTEVQSEVHSTNLCQSHIVFCNYSFVLLYYVVLPIVVRDL
nr:MAG TPA: hypothetical protein [Bacteriophage sp.]